MLLRIPARPAPTTMLAVILAGAATIAASGGQAQDRSPLALDTARVTVEGTSNIHAYTATTSVVRVLSVKLGEGVAGPDFWENVRRPGALEAFEIVIPAVTLSSPKDGLDKNMHKALKVQEHPDITFRLARLEPGAAPDSVTATGTLTIAGVAREVVLPLQTRREDSRLTVRGEIQLLMTDFGIAPPKAMLGMLKTDPRVSVRFEAVLGLSLT